jgi:uncharacterized protein YbbC (DUF1343 family)
MSTRGVETGLEVFTATGSDFAGLPRGARVGLLAHAASIDRRGRHAAERIARATPLRLRRLFAPEHGIEGEAQDMEPVGDTNAPEHGLRVISLYGDDEASLRPTREHLEGLDAVVCDLQDVGSRYYTFVYTISYVMEAAGEAGIPVVVLDRPNPIGGTRVEGPVLEPALASFVGRYPIPVRHGMTPGELATLFRDAFGVRCDLRVVPLAGWSREAEFDATGLPWVPPSPNMPTLGTARVYPGGCLIEGTNLSEGRGTTTPFELVGAPWLDARALAAAPELAALDGVAFRAAGFRPMFQKHAGRACGGVQVLVTDAETFRPFETFLAVIAAARRLDAEAFDWRREPYEFETERLAIDLLLGRADLRSLLQQGAGPDEMRRSWEADLERFRRERQRFLLY